ncbi:energy transducer TonB family protein [Bartonella sp. B30(2025)]
MDFANIRQSSILWICAFVGAFSLHVGLGAKFYFKNTGVGNGTLSQTIMLTFAQDQEIINLDINPDLSSFDTDTDVHTEPEVLQSDFLESESKISESVGEDQTEEVQDIVEKNNLTIPVPKIEHKIPAQKPIQKIKTVVKQFDKQTRHRSIASYDDDAGARENALLVEWLAKVQVQLEKQKNYVVRQRTSRAKGTVQLEFRVREQGDIFSSRIVLSSGDKELDRLAMTALQRVKTVPLPPPSKVNKIIRVSLIFS